MAFPNLAGAVADECARIVRESLHRGSSTQRISRGRADFRRGIRQHFRNTIPWQRFIMLAKQRQRGEPSIGIVLSQDRKQRRDGIRNVRPGGSVDELVG